MSSAGVPYPDPPLGVFDAAPYQAYWPGRARLADEAARERVPSAPKSILIVGLTAVGDVLHFLPVLCALRARFPSARIGWVVQDKARAVVEARGDIDRVHVFERHRWGRGILSPSGMLSTFSEILSFRRGMAEEGYEILFDPQGTGKTALMNLASGVPARVGFTAGFAHEFNHLTTNVRVALPEMRVHRARRALALLEAVGYGTQGPPVRFEVPEDAQAEADLTLDQLGVAGKKILVIHPGTSSRGAWRRWAPDRFAATARRGKAELGLVPLFALGPVERAWRGAIESGRDASLVVEPRSLAHLGGILARASCFLGCDSGPLHLASSVGVPVVGLYGPSDPVLAAPFNPPAVVIVKGLPCPKCGAPHCKHPVPRMDSITVGEAIEGIDLALRLTRPARS